MQGMAPTLVKLDGDGAVSRELFSDALFLGFGQSQSIVLLGTERFSGQRPVQMLCQPAHTIMRALEVNLFLTKHSS